MAPLWSLLDSFEEGHIEDPCVEWSLLEVDSWGVDYGRMHDWILHSSL